MKQAKQYFNKVKKAIFELKKAHYIPLIAGIVLIPLLAEASSIVLSKNLNKKQFTETPIRISQTPTPSTTPSGTITPGNFTEQNFQPVNPTGSSNKITSTPTQKPNSNSSSVRIPNPPKVGISFPSEGQIVNMTEGSFCGVDGPAGGDTSGLVFQRNVNNGGWTAWAPISNLCFEPKDGENTLQAIYMNQYGEQSPIYTVHFTFHRTAQNTPTLPPTNTPVPTIPQ